jgi:predicted Rossmann fold nucleotide-binding protein DprA/Smf involved in DNA uptake
MVAMTRPRIAFIGTRNFDALPPAVALAFRQAACQAARSGAVVVTGAAAGADQAAATLAISLGGPVEIVLPWASYEQA